MSTLRLKKPVKRFVEISDQMIAVTLKHKLRIMPRIVAENICKDLFGKDASRVLEYALNV